MGLENPVHLVFIGIIALLVLGPRRLPELARALGHGLREFRDAMSGEATSGEAHAQIESRSAQTPPLQEPLQAQPGESSSTPPPPAPEAPAPVEPAQGVDPAQTIRSPDATDRGPL